MSKIECRDWQGSEHDLYEYLIAKEKHRHSNTAQLALTAVFNHVRIGYNLKDAIANSGVSSSSFARAMYIAMNDPDITNALRRGDQVLVMLEGKEFYTSSLSKIEQFIKNKKEIEVMTTKEIEEREYKETDEIVKDAKIIIDLVNKSNDKLYVDRLKTFLQDRLFIDYN